MELVVDASFLFSVLIKSGRAEELMFESSLQLFAPEFIFIEFIKYQKTIRDKTGRTKTEFDQLIEVLKQRIRTIPNEETEKHLRIYDNNEYPLE